MRVASKTKIYIAIEVRYSFDFFIEIGKFLDEKYYSLEKSGLSYMPTFFIKVNNNKIETKDGDFILINEEDEYDVKYVPRDIYKKDYLELKEEE